MYYARYLLIGLAALCVFGIAGCGAGMQQRPVYAATPNQWQHTNSYQQTLQCPGCDQDISNEIDQKM